MLLPLGRGGSSRGLQIDYWSPLLTWVSLAGLVLGIQYLAVQEHDVGGPECSDGNAETERRGNFCFRSLAWPKLRLCCFNLMVSMVLRSRGGSLFFRAEVGCCFRCMCVVFRSSRFCRPQPGGHSVVCVCAAAAALIHR
jgi:hypothetical protein